MTTDKDLDKVIADAADAADATAPHADEAPHKAPGAASPDGGAAITSPTASEGAINQLLERDEAAGRARVPQVLIDRAKRALAVLAVVLVGALIWRGPRIAEPIPAPPHEEQLDAARLRLIGISRSVDRFQEKNGKLPEATTNDPEGGFSYAPTGDDAYEVWVKVSGKEVRLRNEDGALSFLEDGVKKDE